MKKLLLLFPLILLMGACNYYSLVMIRNRAGVPVRYDLDYVTYGVWIGIVITILFILRENKQRQDEYRELVESIGKEEPDVERMRTVR